MPSVPFAFYAIIAALEKIQQARNPQQKSELKNKLNDIHHEISNRTQKQLQAFAEQNPSINQPKSELDQSLKR